MLPMLSAEQRPVFVEKYNQTSFLFAHRLHEHGVFDLANLVGLSKRLPDSYWSTEKSDVGSGWGDGSKRRSLPDTVASMGESNSLVLLKGLADDREFAPLYHQVIHEIEAFAGEAFRTDISLGRATLIVSSPGRITPYHIDAETNFLLQLRGRKTVHVFDAGDRTLLTDAELETFYAGDFSGAKYKEHRQQDAQVYDFKPGDGVHIPLHAPHWTQNGSDVSVSLSLNFSLHSNARPARVYRLNRLLRRYGITPRSPGVSPWEDRAKAMVGVGLERARELLRR